MKNKYLAAIIPLILLGTVLGGCAVGVNRVESREIANVSAVSINSFGKFIIIQGDEESLTIEGPNNILRNIETEVIGSTLYIDSTRSIINNSLQPILFTLTVKSINEVSLSGAGSIQIDELDTERLEIILTGAGSIRIDDLNTMDLSVLLNSAGSIAISGTAEEQKIVLSGVGSYEGDDLQSRLATVLLSGAGSADLWVTDDLDVTVSGVGSVAYYGSPSVTQNVSGVGSVASKGEK